MKIVIEGNIGGGKSTVLNMISQRTRIPIFLEPVDTEWKQGLEYFYNDNSRWGFTFNLNVLMTYNKWSNNNFKAVYERCPLSSKEVFSKLQYDSGMMTKYENDMYQELYEKLAWEPDVIIYIKTPSIVCYHRMISRARECETNVPITYLNQVDEKYEDLCKLIKDKNNIKLFTINGDQNIEQVYEDVMKVINTL
jgi:deoxyadenosine/deoxycytidine kinase